MRQVQLQEAEEHFSDLIAEAEAGGSLTIVKGRKAVARIIPMRETQSDTFTPAERAAAREELREMTARGLDLGVVWNGRDELYERD